MENKNNIPAIPSTFFNSSDEKIISILGQEYLHNILNNDTDSKSVLILTNKNLYQAGELFHLNKSEFGYKVTIGKEILPLSEILEETEPKQISIIKITGGCTMIILAFLLGVAIQIIGSFLLVLGLVLTFGAFLKARKFLKIKYKDGHIAVPYDLYDKKAIEDFKNKVVSTKFDQRLEDKF